MSHGNGSSPIAARVELVAWTDFRPPESVAWRAAASGGPALAEFAGRSCYQAWNRDNPATDTNRGYLEHILQVGHHAVLEHASATFYLTGISRALAAELTRHRHFSFSELSPRQPADNGVVEPPVVAADPQLHQAFQAGVEAGLRAHRELLAGLAAQVGATDGRGLWAKQVRQAARTVLPGASATTLVMTGNYRSWRQLLAAHGADHADRELRQVVLAVHAELQELAPGVFDDFTLTALPDGSQVLSSPLAAQ